jgi:molybdopterin guanine dinucleotide-containing S/N-oxide reductase-like protein
MEKASDRVVTCCQSDGPFFAHVVNGVWTKSTPIKPNLPVGANAYAVRNRLYSPDRIMYPMKRIDFSTDERNPQNRGRSGFERISWDEALDLVAGEIDRIRMENGPSAILLSPVSHQWLGSLHRNTVWATRFFSLLGGCTRLVGETSFTGWRPGGSIIWGFGPPSTNNAADILQNSRLIIHWSSDSAAKRYNGNRQNLWLRRFKEANIKQVVIDPYFSDTAALYGDEWIPILPETDEALMAAIAYVWVTENLHDERFIEAHTVGFEELKNYLLGDSDGLSKTPKWASRICGVNEEKINELAHEWASKPTYVMCDYGGANRRYGAAEWSRMIVTMQTLLGNIGRPGRGLGLLNYDTRGKDQKGIEGILPEAGDPYRQFMRHAQFSESVSSPRIKWTTASRPMGEIREMKYPEEGYSKIKMIAFMSDNGWILNQIPGVGDSLRGLQNTEIEFVYCHAAWWHSAPKFADVILPVRHIGERDDIVEWENYTVYSHAVVEPIGEPKNDLDIFVELAKRLGFEKELTLGKSSEEWLREIFSRLDIPLTFGEFREKGYYEYPAPKDIPEIMDVLKRFYDDPQNNKLKTPSGKIEIYSKRVADFFGLNHPTATTIPKHISSPEGLDSPSAAEYPLFLTSSHPKLGEHSQWHNLSWNRDEYQVSIHGHNVMRINPVDANRRELKTGDLVRIYNERGSIICSVYVTERIMPKVIRVSEGGWYNPLFPGDPESPDVGGNPNVLISARQPDALCDGMTNGARVEVEKWGE